MLPGTIIHATFNNIKSQGINKESFFSAFPNIQATSQSVFIRN